MYQEDKMWKRIKSNEESNCNHSLSFTGVISGPECHIGALHILKQIDHILSTFQHPAQHFHFYSIRSEGTIGGSRISKRAPTPWVVRKPITSQTS